MVRLMIVVLALAALMGVCGSTALADSQPRRPVLRNLRCTRSDATSLDVIRVTPDGLLSAYGRTIKTVNRRLSDDEVSDLAKLMAKWDELKVDYPSRADAKADRKYMMRAGNKMVRVSTSNKDLPKDLKRLIRKLEEYAAKPASN